MICQYIQYLTKHTNIYAGTANFRKQFFKKTSINVALKQMQSHQNTCQYSYVYLFDVIIKINSLFFYHCKPLDWRVTDATFESWDPVGVICAVIIKHFQPVGGVNPHPHASQSVNLGLVGRPVLPKTWYRYTSTPRPDKASLSCGSQIHSLPAELLYMDSVHCSVKGLKVQLV